MLQRNPTSSVQDSERGGRTGAHARPVWIRKLLENRLAVLSAAVLILLGIGAILAPVLAPYPPNVQFAGHELAPPNLRFLLGTDEFGRDILTRLMYGARISLSIAALTGISGLVIGGNLGLVAAYLGGWTDGLLMRFVDALFAMPTVLVAIAITAALGPGYVSVALGVGIAVIPGFVRIARSAALAEMNKEYVEAARMAGARGARILFRHILPNALGPLLVLVAISMSVAIELEAGLSFLGVGIQPPQASWGVMLQESREHLYSDPWYPLFPGLFLTAVVLSLNFLSDAIRDAIDPSMQRPRV